MDKKTILENSVCLDCQWLDEKEATCIAFPLGIPKKYTQGGAKHNTPDKGQLIGAVFTPKLSEH